MALDIDFARLDLRSALDFAIGMEEDAQLRYEELSRTVEDPAAAAFFREMIEVEAGHRRHLEARRGVLFRHAPREFEHSLDDEREAPATEDVSPSITAREAMELALRGEARAYEFFARAIPHVRDPDVRQLFAELRDEELEHEAAVRERLRALDGARAG